MIWYIILVLCGVSMIGCLLAAAINRDTDWLTVMGVPLLLFITVGLLVFTARIGYEQDYNNFVEQKQYIETVVPTQPDANNVAITIKKIELNTWLYNVRYKKKHYAFWNVVPDKVMNLEEIK